MRLQLHHAHRSIRINYDTVPVWSRWKRHLFTCEAIDLDPVSIRMDKHTNRANFALMNHLNKPKVADLKACGFQISVCKEVEALQKCLDLRFR